MLVNVGWPSLNMPNFLRLQRFSYKKKNFVSFQQPEVGKQKKSPIETNNTNEQNVRKSLNRAMRHSTHESSSSIKTGKTSCSGSK